MAEKMEGMPSSWPYSQRGLAARAALLNLHKLPQSPSHNCFCPALPEEEEVPGGGAEEEDKEN